MDSTGISLSLTSRLLAQPDIDSLAQEAEDRYLFTHDYLYFHRHRLSESSKIGMINTCGCSEADKVRLRRTFLNVD